MYIEVLGKRERSKKQIARERPGNEIGLSKKGKHCGEGTKKGPLPVTIQKMTKQFRVLYL